MSGAETIKTKALNLMAAVGDDPRRCPVVGGRPLGVLGSWRGGNRCEIRSILFCGK